MGLIVALWDVFATIGLVVVLLFLALFVWLITQILWEFVIAAIQIIRAQRWQKKVKGLPTYTSFVSFLKCVWWVAVTTAGGTLTIGGYVIPRNPFRPIGWEPDDRKDEEED